MNAIITRYKKTVLVMMAVFALNANASAPEKCKPCQIAAAARLSAQAAAAASLVQNQSGSREMELDLNEDEQGMVRACCAYCAQEGSLGCQGANSDRCAVCQAGILKMAMARAAQALAELNAVTRQKGSDEAVRAPREELVDPCSTCGTEDPCSLNSKLQAIFNCCVNTNQHVVCQEHDMKKCCRKIRHEIDGVEDLIGAPNATSFGEQNCALDVVTFVNSTDADVMTWLKSLYVLMYQVLRCTCCLT